MGGGAQGGLKHGMVFGCALRLASYTVFHTTTANESELISFETALASDDFLNLNETAVDSVGKCQIFVSAPFRQ